MSYLHALYLAGMHTTVNQTALSLHALFQNRSQWQQLVDLPGRIDTAVEELLRYGSPRPMTAPTHPDRRLQWRDPSPVG